MVGNKNVTSVDLENVDQGHCLQNHLGYYMTDFNKIFTKMMQLGLVTKPSYKLTLKM